jgi:hypothetical protein
MAIFGFPDEVNDAAARVVACGVVVMALVAIAARQPWVTILLAYGFVARVAAGPRLSPLGRFAVEVAAPRLSRYARLVPGPPKRFAQAMGAAFSASALGLWLAGEDVACYVLLAILIVPASLEASLGYCVGCEAFKVLMRLGVIPTSVCEQCANIWSRPAASTST